MKLTKYSQAWADRSCILVQPWPGDGVDGGGERDSGQLLCNGSSHGEHSTHTSLFHHTPGFWVNKKPGQPLQFNAWVHGHGFSSSTSDQLLSLKRVGGTMFFTILVVIPSRYILALYNVSLARPVDMDTCLLSGSYGFLHCPPPSRSKDNMQTHFHSIVVECLFANQHIASITCHEECDQFEALCILLRCFSLPN